MCDCDRRLTWLWYHTVIGGERCPIVDTWWQTETGSIMISPLPGLTRSGKIMRRLLRDIAEGREPGDATTLGDPSVLDRLPQATASEST